MAMVASRCGIADGATVGNWGGGGYRLKRRNGRELEIERLLDGGADHLWRYKSL